MFKLYLSRGLEKEFGVEPSFGQVVMGFMLVLFRKGRSGADDGAAATFHGSRID